MTKYILLLVALCAVTGQARAGYFTLNDPLETSAVEGDRIILASGSDATDPNAAQAVSATQTSIAFTSAARYALFTFDVTACVGPCSITFQLQNEDPDGVWWNYAGFTAVTSATPAKYRYLVGCDSQGGAAAGCYIADTTGITAAPNKPLPGRWRVNVVWTSGTSATYTVGAVTW